MTAKQKAAIDALREHYAAVLDEPIPAEWLDLLARLK